MKRIFVIAAMLLMVAVNGWAGPKDVKGYGKWKNDNNKNGTLYICAIDTTEKTRILWTNVFVGDSEYNISRPKYWCQGQTNIIDPVFNAQYGSPALPHCRECQLDPDEFTGTKKWVNFVGYWNFEVDKFTGTALPDSMGLKPSQMMMPGVPPPPVCSFKTCQVCDGVLVGCP